MTWTLTTEKPHPDKPGKASYEQIRCLVVYRGDVLIRWWNCEHLCWDDESADDHFCGAADVTAWMLAPEPPTDGEMAAAPEVPKNVADQIAAASAIIARLASLLQQPRPHTAPLPYLPNEVPAALQVPAMQLLQAAGLDMHGRPVEAGQ